MSPNPKAAYLRANGGYSLRSTPAHILDRPRTKISPQAAEFGPDPRIVDVHMSFGHANIAADPIDESRPLRAPHLAGHYAIRGESDLACIAFREALSGLSGGDGALDKWVGGGARRQRLDGKSWR